MNPLRSLFKKKIPISLHAHLSGVWGSKELLRIEGPKSTECTFSWIKLSSNKVQDKELKLIPYATVEDYEKLLGQKHGHLTTLPAAISIFSFQSYVFVEDGVKPVSPRRYVVGDLVLYYDGKIRPFSVKDAVFEMSKEVIKEIKNSIKQAVAFLGDFVADEKEKVITDKAEFAAKNPEIVRAMKNLHEKMQQFHHESFQSWNQFFKTLRKVYGNDSNTFEDRQAIARILP